MRSEILESLRNWSTVFLYGVLLQGMWPMLMANQAEELKTTEIPYICLYISLIL
jgi:hypothetical protein